MRASRKKFKLGLITVNKADGWSSGRCPAFACLAAYIEKRFGAAVEVIVTDDERLLAGKKPDLVGITSLSVSFDGAVALAERLRKTTSAPIVIGGYHISALPHTLPKAFDAGVLGEGEETLGELTAQLLRGGLAPGELKKIRGLVFHEGGKRVLTGNRALLSPLDQLPFPRIEENPGDPGEARIFTSRGCLFRCGFCAAPRHWKGLRVFSAGYVVEYMEKILATLGRVERISVYEDIFVADKARFREILRLILRKGLHKRVSFEAAVRADLLDDEMCRDFRKANFTKIRFGAESGSDSVLKRLKRGAASVRDNQAAVDLCGKHGIAVAATFMVGAPWETKKDMFKTLDFIRKNRRKLIAEAICVAMPIPGSERWAPALREGLVSENMRWNRLNFHLQSPGFDWDNFVYSNRHIQRAEFVKIIRRFLAENCGERRTNDGRR